MKKIFIVNFCASLLFSASAMSMTFCDAQLKELKDYAIVAQYESLPVEQQSSFIAQLEGEQVRSLMAMRSGHQLGAALANSTGTNYKRTLTDIFEEKKQAFMKKCGFMLQRN